MLGMQVKEILTIHARIAYLAEKSGCVIVMVLFIHMILKMAMIEYDAKLGRGKGIGWMRSRY